MNATRMIALAMAVTIAGLSSSFALCVSACTDELATAESHACHDDTAAVSIAALEGACPHSPTVVRTLDLSRDDRTAPAFVRTVPATSTLPPLPDLQTPSHRAARAPARPVASRAVLRI